MPGNIGEQERKKLISYVLLAAGLFVLFYLSRSSDWKGAKDLHTLMEVIATVVALSVGVLGLVRYRSQPNNTILIISAAFLGTALLDGYHALVTSRWFDIYWRSPPPQLIPWSWNASRTFLAMMLVLSWLAWRREKRLGVSGTISPLPVFTTVGVLTVASFVFFAFTPLPPAYYPDQFFGRPEELVSASLFLLALVGYLRKGVWKKEPFEHWLVLSLIVNAVCQLAFMSTSHQLFDGMFDLAHLLKKLSYICVLTGLQISLLHVLVRAEKDKKALAESEGRLREAYAGLKQISISLAESETWHRTLVENMVEGVVVIDRNGLIQSFNRAAEKIFGHHAEDVIGRNVNILIPVEQRAAHDEGVAVYRGAGVSKEMGIDQNLQGLRADGRLFDIEMSLKALDIEGNHSVIALVRDVSTRKHAERAIREKTDALARSNTELEQFAYVASHDLQEPLRTVNSFVQLLAQRYQGKLDADADKWIAHIVDGSQRMKQLIQDLLSYSRVNSRGAELKPVDAGDVLDNLLTDLSVTSAEAQAGITRGPMPIVLADVGQLHQLLQNLIGNGIKYHSPDRPPEIHVGAERLDDTWRFSVHDNGIGIEHKYFDRIFEIFQRLHSRSQHSGTGIGLAICKRIVERHGGRIWLESTPGEGSTFFFTLPAADARVSESFELDGKGGSVETQPLHASR